tara:strand:- start:338 stop:598 length:261 start_codon:yes stop_codon:yes gene_type:complete
LLQLGAYLPDNFSPLNPSPLTYIGRTMSGTITSPCVSICAMNEKDLCIGCYRTSKEIREWLLMEDDERLDVIVKAGERARENNPFA